MRGILKRKMSKLLVKDVWSFLGVKTSSVAWQPGNLDGSSQVWVACGLLKTRGPRGQWDHQSRNGAGNGDWDWWCWEAGRREQVKSRWSPRVALHILWPSVSLPFPLTFHSHSPLAGVLPWPFPRLANLASHVLNYSAGLWQRRRPCSKSRRVPNHGRFP